MATWCPGRKTQTSCLHDRWAGSLSSVLDAPGEAQQRALVPLGQSHMARPRTRYPGHGLGPLCYFILQNTGKVERVLGEVIVFCGCSDKLARYRQDRQMAACFP